MHEEALAGAPIAEQTDRERRLSVAQADELSDRADIRIDIELVGAGRDIRCIVREERPLTRRDLGRRNIRLQLCNLIPYIQPRLLGGRGALSDMTDKQLEKVGGIRFKLRNVLLDGR